MKNEELRIKNEECRVVGLKPIKNEELRMKILNSKIPNRSEARTTLHNS